MLLAGMAIIRESIAERFVQKVGVLPKRLSRRLAEGVDFVETALVMQEKPEIE
jgi:hypothetical protein